MKRCGMGVRGQIKITLCGRELENHAAVVRFPYAFVCYAAEIGRRGALCVERNINRGIK